MIHVSATIIKPSLMELVPWLPRHKNVSRKPTARATRMVRPKLTAQRSPYSSDTAIGSTRNAASNSTTRPMVYKTIL